jgi:hypothetical protein
LLTLLLVALPQCIVQANSNAGYTNNTFIRCKTAAGASRFPFEALSASFRGLALTFVDCPAGTGTDLRFLVSVGYGTSAQTALGTGICRVSFVFAV